jgi:ribose transport system ATP-binding protein
MSLPTPLLSIREVSKSFSGVQVLHDVNLDLFPGEVMALLGENGAGKSTLMNIVSGGLSPDRGSLVWEGNSISLPNTAAALRLGISHIYQELSAVGALSVMENLYLDDYRSNRWGVIDRRKMTRDARSLLADLGAAHIHPETEIARLGIADQQMVEIAKAVSRNARLVIMDEPTSSLTVHEVATLFAIIREMRSKRVSIVFISHRLEEAMSVANRAVVLRDGRVVSDRPMRELRRETLLADMAGRAFSFSGRKPRMPAPDAPILLSVHGIESDPGFGPFTFDLRQGGVLGVFGLVSSGRTELLQMLCGLRHPIRGSITLFDGRSGPRSLAEAWRRGLAYLPEDRKQNGIFPQLSVAENIILSRRNARRVSLAFTRGETETIQSLYQQLGIRAAGCDQEIRYLSGGNQQKTILGRCLAVSPRVLLLDEPTHGVDVRTKSQLYDTIDNLAQEGIGLVVVSSEIPEILALASSIMVLAHGHQTLLVQNDGLSDRTLLEAAFQERGARETLDSILQTANEHE